MINQSVIFIPIIILKTEITKSHVMTKVPSITHFTQLNAAFYQSGHDRNMLPAVPHVSSRDAQDDTSPDGWKIRIVIEPDTVTITHSRRELPLGTYHPTTTSLMPAPSLTHSLTHSFGQA
jgi:hypothetical protein